MQTDKIIPMSDKYHEYLIDESKYEGNAESISFPKSTKEVSEIIQALQEKPITIQGGKTGIVGGAVPKGGHIMNLSHMNQIIDFKILEDGTGRISVEAGITLEELQQEIDKRAKGSKLFWPPQPTENSATVGGIAAVDAKGINSFYYGDSRQYIEQIKIVLADGTCHQITRDNQEELPVLDLVLGSEGILGVITELTLVLLPKPEEVWGIAFFWENIKEASEFCDALVELPKDVTTAHITAMEFIDGNTINAIALRKNTMTKIKALPDIEENVRAMVYLEIEGDEEGISEIAESLMMLAEENGSDSDNAWAVSGQTEIEKMHAYRHAAAETVNMLVEETRQIHRKITKLGLDVSDNRKKFSDTLEKYYSDIEQTGMKGYIFGHIGGNHLHVNLVVDSDEEYKAGKELLKKWMRCIDHEYGDIAVEHGVGKLKQKLMDYDRLEEYRDIYRVWKMKLDQKRLLNPGNIFAQED